MYMMLPNLIQISLEFWPPKIIKNYKEIKPKKCFLVLVLDAHPDHNMPPTTRNKE